MFSDPLFLNALRINNIPFPIKAHLSNNFFRWGKNGRYWAIKIADGYAFGDFVQDLKSNVFPAFENNKSEIEYRRAKALAIAADKIKSELLFEQQNAKIRALKIWNNSKILRSDHPYLLKKQALSYGLKSTDLDKLVIPLYDINNELWSLQFIAENGDKRLLLHGKKCSNFFKFGEIKNTIFLCEGYATASSIYLATQETVIMCIDCGNLETVGKAFKSKFPEKELIFCADNDRFNAENIGIKKAQSAAENTFSKFIAPIFPQSDLISTDFNDLHCNYGLEFVREQISCVWSKS